MRYTTVLFDLDHTLLDSDASHDAAFEVTMRSIGLDDPWAVFATFDAINQSLWRRVEGNELHPDEVKVRRFEELLDVCGLEGDATEMGGTFADALTRYGALYPGAGDLLARLARCVQLGLVSNGIGSVQRGRLQRLGIADLFDAVVISGEVGASKPGSAIFDLALESLDDPDRSDCVMIGDNLGSDVLGGHRAGIDTVWFNPDGHPLGEHLAPTYTIRTLDQIAEIIEPGLG